MVYERTVTKPLFLVVDRFSFSLDRREEPVHDNLGVILVESREEPGFKVNPRIYGTAWKASEPVKGYSP